MSSQVHIEWINLKRTVDDLVKFEAELLPVIRDLNKAVAEKIARAAAVSAPRVSGMLADSITSGATKYAGFVKMGGGQVPYAGPITYGWPAHNIKPNKFLYDAFDQRRDMVRADLEAGIHELVSRTFHGSL